jgi:hypothetical protein
MCPMKRWLGLFLMGVAVSSPIIVSGCAEHANVRVYDPYYGDYHVWNHDEVVYYHQWVVETHRDPIANFARCRPRSSGNTGRGGITIRITTEEKAQIQGA